MKENKFPFKLQQEDAIKIINSACTTSWKETLIDKWCHEIFINGIVEINEQFYKEMRCDCNETQHKLFDDIFGKDELIIKYKIGDIIMTLDKANENPMGNENDDKEGRAECYIDQLKSKDTSIKQHVWNEYCYAHKIY